MKSTIPFPKFFILLFFVAFVEPFSGCGGQRDVRESDTLTTASTGGSANDPLADSGTPTTTERLDSAKLAAPATTSPPSDSRADLSPVHLKFIGRAESTAKGVFLYVVGVDETDSTTDLHCILINRSRDSSVRTAIPLISSAQLVSARLLDDQTGKAYTLRLPEEWKKRGLAIPTYPGDTKDFNASFHRVPRSAATVTLVIPNFATIPGVSLPR